MDIPTNVNVVTGSFVFADELGAGLEKVGEESGIVEAMEGGIQNVFGLVEEVLSAFSVMSIPVQN